MKFFSRFGTRTDPENPYQAVKVDDSKSAYSAEQLTALADIDALLKLSAPRLAENEDCGFSPASNSIAELEQSMTEVGKENSEPDISALLKLSAPPLTANGDCGSSEGRAIPSENDPERTGTVKCEADLGRSQPNIVSSASNSVVKLEQLTFELEELKTLLMLRVEREQRKVDKAMARIETLTEAISPLKSAGFEAE